MTERKGKSGTIDVKALLAGDEEFLRALVRTALQEVLEVCKFRSFRQAISAESGRRFRLKPAGRFGPKRHPIPKALGAGFGKPP